LRFGAAGRLWLLGVVVALLVAYVVVQRQRRSYAVRFTNVDLLASVAPRRPGWRRHVAAASFLVAMGLLVGALAHPTRPAKVPSRRGTIIVALDVSQSMAANDVSPSRIVAAQRAAEHFVRDLPARFQVGVVTFAGGANLVAPPSSTRDEAVAAIANLKLAQHTAIGEAIFTSLDAIHQQAITAKVKVPARIVLLSDGATNSGRSNEDAAAAALKATVPVYAIAFGTTTGSVAVGDEVVAVPADRDSLREIATTTHGTFATAASAKELRDVYKDLGSLIVYTTKQREVSTWFVGIALVFALAAGAFALIWTSRLP
jgi:Ca-activated chloride channel family protein